jgi:hypothetical protein
MPTIEEINPEEAEEAAASALANLRLAAPVQQLSAPESLQLLPYHRSFGAGGSSLGELNGPWGITALADGSLCITEREGPRVQVVRPPPDGVEHILECRAVGLPEGVDDIQDCVAIGDHLIVSDMGDHCLHRLDLAARASVSATPLGIQNGHAGGSSRSPIGGDDLRYPRALAALDVGSDPSLASGSFGPRLPETLVFVCDSGNGRVLSMDVETGEVVRAIGQKGACDGTFVGGHLELPLGLCAFAGEIFVVDGHTHRVSVFSATSGAYLRCIGVPGNGVGELQSPFDAEVVRGMLVVTEATRVQLFSLDGQPKGLVEVPGASNLAGVCASTDGERLYACDYSNGCVHELAVGWEAMELEAAREERDGGAT